MVSKEAIRRQLGLSLNHAPWLKSQISKIMFAAWRARLSSQSRTAQFDVLKTIYVDPSRIKKTLRTNPFHKYTDRGRIVSGNWDDDTTVFDELDIAKAIQARFSEGASWQETEFYARVLSEIADGKMKWGCRSREEFDGRCKAIEALYSDIKTNGFRPQSEIAKQQNNPYKGEDEISVHVDRKGELIFDDGRHRLAIAKQLKLDKVPVKVTVRHRRWADFVAEIQSYADARGGRVYHRPSHPDLQDIEFTHGDERFDVMVQNLPVESGKVLDIGAHWGYFSHQFEAAGFECCAVEADARAAYFLRKLRDADQRCFKVFEQSVFDFQEDIKFDIVLAMSVFHHFIKTKPGHEALRALLGRLEMRHMYFQPHEVNAAQMSGSYKNYTPEEFVQFILENSMLTRAKLLANAFDNRPTYLLSA